jgi:hypothetical protein
MTNSTDSPWAELQIPPTADVRTIRRAYAQRLRTVHPEENPEGFQRLRQAYELALWITSLGEASLDVPTNAVTPTAIAPLELSKDLPTLSAPQAHGFIARIFESYQNFGEEGAIQTLKSMLRSPQMENIELRFTFETGLAEALLQREPPVFKLAAQLASEFQWDQTTTSNFAIQQLLYRLEGWHGYCNLLRLRDSLVQRGSLSLKSDVITPLQARAIDMLVSPFDRRRFLYYHVFRPGLAHAVQSQLARLQLSSPSTVNEFLNPETVQWWARRKLRPLSAWAFMCSMPLLYLAFLVNNNLWAIWELWVIPLIAIILVGAVGYKKRLELQREGERPPRKESRAKYYALFVAVSIFASYLRQKQMVWEALAVVAIGAIALAIVRLHLKKRSS